MFTEILVSPTGVAVAEGEFRGALTLGNNGSYHEDMSTFILSVPVGGYINSTSFLNGTYEVYNNTQFNSFVPIYKTLFEGFDIDLF